MQLKFEQGKPIELWDMVVRKDRQPLRSGCFAYEFAVVISMSPFALASKDGDMLWFATVMAKDFDPLARAPENFRQDAMRRLSDLPNQPDQRPA